MSHCKDEYVHGSWYFVPVNTWNFFFSSNSSTAWTVLFSLYSELQRGSRLYITHTDKPKRLKSISFLTKHYLCVMRQNVQPRLKLIRSGDQKLKIFHSSNFRNKCRLNTWPCPPFFSRGTSLSKPRSNNHTGCQRVLHVRLYQALTRNSISTFFSLSVGAFWPLRIAQTLARRLLTELRENGAAIAD